MLITLYSSILHLKDEILKRKVIFSQNKNFLESKTCCVGTLREEHISRCRRVNLAVYLLLL